MQAHRFPSLPLLVATLCGGVSFGQTLIEVDFPDGIGTNPVFTEIDNGVGVTNTWTQESGVFVTSTNANSTVGAASETAVDFTALGSEQLVLRVDVDSTSFGAPSANGMFIGFQDSNAGDGSGLWNNHNPSFGFWMGGGPHGAPARDIGVGGGTLAAPRNRAVGYGIATLESISDGFSITLTISSVGWSLVVNGLVDDADVEITGGEGTWDEGVFDFASFTADMHVGMSIQTPLNDVGGMTLSNITLTQQPTSGGTSGLQILSLDYDDDAADPSAMLSWESQLNRTYAVDYSTDLGEAGWIEINDSVSSEGATTSFEHQFLPSSPELVGSPKIFYRVRDVTNN